MATVKLIEYDEASPEVKAVFDDIRTTRKTDYINNFWKALAHHPETLKRTWENVRDVMVAGEIDSVTKELIYLAVSIINNCEYCVHSHTASATAKGMTPGQYQELLAVVAIATQTNALATAFQVPIDAKFLVE